MNDLIIGYIRTIVPVVVGTVVTVAAGYDITVDGPGLEAVIVGVLISVYYIVVRALEEKFPQVGWLLGHATTASYEDEETS